MIITPATPETLPRLGHVFGPREKDPDSCWCQRFRRHAEPDNRTALQREIETAPIPIGLLAWDGDDAVGWTRVVPRSTLPGVTGNRALARVLDAETDAWWVACVVVRRDHRGEGVGAELVRAAVDWAAGHGASVLDGHPVATDGRARSASPSALFTGTVSMFRRAGFTELARTVSTRPVMRRVFGPGRCGD